MSEKAMKFIVSGLVQGVGFRYHTCHEGIKRGLTGYAKNLMNGDVEVIACGNEQQVDSIHDWLKQGPVSARVDRLVTEVIEVKPYSRFEIRY